MEIPQIIFLIIMVISVILFVSEVLRVDVIAVLIILALTLTGLLDAKAAFSGFASEPAIIVAAVFILSAGLSLTGVTDAIGRLVASWSGNSEVRANLVIMISVAALSAFTHHLMVTAMMLPIVMKICKEKSLHSSRLLIPMATAASLGTTLTLIGAPAFLLANSILTRSGEASLGIFTVAKVGGPLCLVSFLFIVLMKWILPRKSGIEDNDDRFKLTEISTELIIPENSKWIGLTFKELKEASEKRFQIFGWLQNGKIQDQHRPERTLKMGDVFLVKIGSDELVSIEEKLGLALKAVKKFGNEVSEGNTSSLTEEEGRIFEGVIAPRSEFIGKTLSEIHFFHRYGAAAIGVWRKTGWILNETAVTPLREGDLIVLWGPEEKLEQLTRHRGFLMFLPFNAKSTKRIKMRLSGGIMAASILVAAMGWVPAHVAFVAGALAMILTRCLSVEQGYDSIETKIFVMIAGVIPLGIAMEKTGVDKLLAQFVVQYTQGWEPIAMLMVFFWFAAFVTQILSDAATTVLLAPIALAFAKSAQISPTAAVITVTIGAVASFLTPIGHHGNLLILSPGGYKFSDFLKIGLPLTMIISIMTCYLCLMIWGT